MFKVVSNRQLYYFSLLLALLIHGPMLFVSFENTYDAFVHIFFAEHYSNNWFDQWNYKWYTGFTVTSYPPLVHMLIALLSKFVGLKGGFIVVALISVILFVRGVFYFSQLWVSERSAAYASCAASVCSSYTEAVHIFGQLPSITGIAILLNTLPIVYEWVMRKKKKHLLLSLGLLSIITTTHHVTTIFGMVFFIFPVLGLALIDKAQLAKGKVTIGTFLLALKKEFFPLLFFGILSLIITVVSIFPYWYWSKSDPISQIPIPHGSRDSFIEVLSSGLVFFLIPWGLMLLFLPYLFSSVFRRRNIILGLSLTLAFILGTGGTTPIPLKLLGETAFNILTLDRFTYWATILSLPFWGEFLYQLIQGDFKTYLSAKIGANGVKILLSLLAVMMVTSTIFIMNIGFFRPFQPDKVDIQPIQNFLSRDNHDQWRYLTLGFGDQVAWLAANTNALSIDGNYHSARRLPEMTTRVVERLENAKYQGLEGLGALHQFLSIPEKYNLKYIFNNDKFYEPILYFSGWNKVTRLENNIAIWEKPDIQKLPELLPRKNIPKYQQLMWSFYPISMLSLVLTLLSISFLFNKKNRIGHKHKLPQYSKRWVVHIVWALITLLAVTYFCLHNIMKQQDHGSPESIIIAFFDALDYKYFNKVYDYYDPELKPSKEQIFLDISLEDGIINSFGKLNNLYVDIISQTEHNATAEVKAEWITSLGPYDTRHTIDVFKRESKWYLESPSRELKLPPARTIHTAQLDYNAMGKRDAIVGNTSHDDILDRPDVTVLQANMVETNGAYYIVGEIENSDIVPAYITVSGSLLNEENNAIISYNARDVLTQRLSPKQRTFFKIDFRDITTQFGISQDISQHSSSENPFCQIDLPVSFTLNVKSLQTTTTSYNKFGALHQNISSNEFTADIYNYGSEGVNIPQVLLATMNNSNEVIWVQNYYLEKEVRPMRSKHVRIDLIDSNDVYLIQKAQQKNIVVNGYSSENNKRLKKTKKLYSLDNLHVSVTGFVIR